ncbi:MAG: methyltransferase domain-containing protein [Candidatus Rokubacteria bacterium]|nr:methyltransferase domain-containing protein [Candidatus Rokubacteria bacterium]
MKSRATEFLVCPRCTGQLDLAEATTNGTEIMDGMLTCPPCDARYPIRGGVPRFVQNGRYAESFGYEWSLFKAVQLDAANRTSESEDAFREQTGWTRPDIEGALVLDAGVGAGRYADVVSHWGGEVVGVDLTSAVDSAFENVGRRERVHLVQADLFAMPFRPGTFQVAFSIGVLHHTPDPALAFNKVAQTIRRGGQMAIYVYPAIGLARHSSDVIRRVATRLPLPVMYWMSALAIPLYYPYRLPVLGRVLQTLLPVSPHPNWRWRWLNTFDWYTPKYQFKLTYPEVFRWFKTAGFVDIDVLEIAICMRGVKA